MDNDRNYFLPKEKLQELIDALQGLGFSCVGPQVRDGAIVYDRLTEAKQLPWGIRAHQAPGEYRLESLPMQRAFSWANGPQAIKPLLFKPSETVWRVERSSTGKLEFKPYIANESPIAIIGARSCDLVAMAIQDKVFYLNLIKMTATEDAENLYLLLPLTVVIRLIIAFVFRQGLDPTSGVLSIS
nr:hypothetical protein [Legionella tunisiensis]